jgi:hypothetical protein
LLIVRPFSIIPNVGTYFSALPGFVKQKPHSDINKQRYFLIRGAWLKYRSKILQFYVEEEIFFKKGGTLAIFCKSKREQKRMDSA